MVFKCMECGGSLVQTDSDIVCIDCGLISNKIFEKPSLQQVNSINNYGNQYTSISERPSSMKTLGTFVGKYRKHNFIDSLGVNLSQIQKLQYRRLKSLNDIYSHFSGRQREYRGYTLLSRVCGSLELTDAAKADSLFLFQKVHKTLRKEIKLSSLIMGTIYIAVRARKENVELKRLIKSAQINGYNVAGKEIIKAASLIRQNAKVRIQYVKSEEYLDSIISRMQRDYSLRELVKRKINPKVDYYIHLRIVTKKLLTLFPLKKRGGRNPFVLATAMINAADIILARKKIFPDCYLKKCRRGILTQKKLSKILDIAEFTLREHYLLLAKPLIDRF